jgi:hypothetical protein
MPQHFVKSCAGKEKSCLLFARPSSGPKAQDGVNLPVRNCKLTVNLIAHPRAVASFRQFTLDLEQLQWI